MLITKLNILVVCGPNKRRSVTAEKIFKDDKRINIKSVGLGSTNNKKIKQRDIEWADYILTMEEKYKLRIVDQYKKFEIPEIFVLDVEDRYEFMDVELCSILKTKIESVIKQLKI